MHSSRSSILKKKKKSLLNIVNLKNCSSRYNLKPKLKHVDNRNELKNNKAISKRCQGLEFRSLDPVGKSGRAIGSFVVTIVRR